MQNMQKSLFSSFNQESSGGAGGAISRILGGSMAAASSASAPSDASFSLSSVLGGSALMDAEPAMETTPKKCTSSAGVRKRGGASDLAAAFSPPAQAVKIEQLDQAHATKRNRVQGQQPIKQEEVAPENAGKKHRGRPALNLLGDVAKEAQLFSESDESDVLWWGREVATKKKDLTLQRSRLQQRMRNSKDLEEVADLKVAERKLNVMVSLVEAAQKHGVGSTGFMAVFEIQVSMLNLAQPPLDLVLPPWLHHSQGIVSRSTRQAPWIAGFLRWTRMSLHATALRTLPLIRKICSARSSMPRSRWRRTTPGTKP